MASSSSQASGSSGTGSVSDIIIDPQRLEWCPDDSTRVEAGGTLLGEGTFGSVYRGEMDGGCVAIKVIKAPRGPPGERASASRRAAEAQHAREIRRLMELRFRHVVQCYGVSRSPTSNELLIITECLNGGSLHQSLERARRADAALTDLSFLTIASHMAKGLLYIHNSYYIHGDMKPHNVLLNVSITVDQQAKMAYFPDHVEAKVADFGMSKRLKQDNPSTLLMSTAEFGNHPCGTYAYMAPESFQGVRDLSNERLKAVDVYALGVCLYEMLSGMSPWKYEGVASPMQLQHMVCWERRRPTWSRKKVRQEYKELVERCWDHDSSRRPTARDLKQVFDRWLREARQRNAMSTSTIASNPGSSTESSSMDGMAVPPPQGGRPPRLTRDNRAAVPPPLPTAPTIIRNDPLDEFARVESRDAISDISARRGDRDAPEDRLVRDRGSSPSEDGSGRAALTPGSQDVSDNAGSTPTGSGSEVKRVSSHELDDLADEPEEYHDDGDGRHSSDASSSHSSGRSGGDRDRDNSEAGRTDGSEGTVESRRQYWEGRGPSVKLTMMVQEQASTYSIGESVANPVEGSRLGLPGDSESDDAAESAVPSDQRVLEYTATADAVITRVQTQPLKEPERPTLGIPLPGASGEDFFSNGRQPAQAAKMEWDDSLLGAVERQNRSDQGGDGRAGASDESSSAVGGMVEKFEALNVDRPTRPGGNAQTGDHVKVVGGGAQGYTKDQEAAMKAMGMFSADVESAGVQPLAAAGARVRRPDGPDDVYSTAQSQKPAGPVRAEGGSGSQAAAPSAGDAELQSAGSSSRPNGHVAAPVAGQPLNPGSQGAPAQPTLALPRQPAYPPPPRQQTLPGDSRAQYPRPGQSNAQAVPTYAAPHAGASTFPGMAPQLTIGNVLQALQSRDGVTQVQRWWADGHQAVVAAALSRPEGGRSGGPGRIALVIDLLRKLTASEISNSSPSNSAVARDLCLALGNVSRGSSISKSAAQVALPMTLSAMKAFTWNMNVYSAACYALANVLKVSNDIPDDRVRRDVADWISHATSFNLNNSSGSEPTLAYLTAAAARNFVWRKATNATTFFARRETQNVVHASAAENLCKSMIYFQPDPTVVEACLSAFAALAFFPSHRINLISIGTISAVTRVMERPTNGSHEALLTMGLATLGIIVARQANPREANQIVEAFISEGGVRTVVKVLDDAVRVRQARVREEGLYALASIARFDQRLGQHIVQNGGVGPVIQAVFCLVNGTPDTLTTRAAEVMCDVVDALSRFPAAAGTMRRTALSQPLATLVQRFDNEQRVVTPGRQAIGRIA